MKVVIAFTLMSLLFISSAIYIEIPEIPNFGAVCGKSAVLYMILAVCTYVGYKNEPTKKG